jgi:hypothetical protein
MPAIVTLGRIHVDNMPAIITLGRIHVDNMPAIITSRPYSSVGNIMPAIITLGMFRFAVRQQ